MVLAPAAMMLWLSACEKPVQLALTDTEGRSFHATCKGGGCTVEDAGAHPSSPRPDGAEARFSIHRASRYLAVCDVWATGPQAFKVEPIDCRALTCKADTDCPPAKGLSKGACANGLCIEPSGPLTAEDAALLCLAGTGAPAGTSQQVERFALGNNCGSPCRVPAVCRQP